MSFGQGLVSGQDSEDELLDGLGLGRWFGRTIDVGQFVHDRSGVFGMVDSGSYHISSYLFWFGVEVSSDGKFPRSWFLRV